MVSAALLTTLAVIMLLSLKIGAVPVAWRDIFLPDSMAGKIVWQLRLPRILLAALSGAALAVSGMILQAIMRNPLASPGIIGVSSGGGLGTVIMLMYLPEYNNFTISAAMIGALAAAGCIYFLAWHHGIQPLRLILAGVAFSALLGALTSAVLLLNSHKVVGVLDFLSGSFAARNMANVQLLWPWVVAGGGLAFALAKSLDVLLLGDDMATALGIKVEQRRLTLLIIAAGLAAAAVSVAGLLSFVGLIAPHTARRLSGSGHRFLTLNSALTGAILTVLCDMVGRVVIAPRELPAGVLLALIGAPFFLWILAGTGRNHEN